jgi:RNA polymerase sigma factor for flagellar operon FliA
MSTTTCEKPPVPVIAELRPTAQELWQRYHKRADINIENALVEQYLPLVSAIMGRLAMTLPDHVDHDDLRSAGLVGLLQAMRNYDPTCGTSFETYARVRIRGAMLDELRRMDWVPRSIHEKARRIQDVMGQLEQKLGTTPTDAQMAKAMSLSPSEYSELLDEVRPAAFVCLDAVSSRRGRRRKPL